MTDVIVGLQFGDEGKGKVTKHLMEETKYDVCVRFNGGPNAGHTIYYKGNKLVTHQVPTGIVHDKLCLIGPNCVIDVSKLLAEIEMLESYGIPDVRKNIKIAYNAHIIQSSHIKDDVANDMSGSTKSGIRPVYRDKYDRIGLRADKYKNICGCDIVDPYEFLKLHNNILFEGAQGFMLDIDWGHYPFVTSSHCTSSMITSCGYSFRKVKDIYGVAKIYNTYIGKMNFQPDDNSLDKLAVMGEEYGSTTGRPRQCNWLNLDELNKAIEINSVNKLIINKCDIICALGIYKLYHNDVPKQFESFELMKKYIDDNIDKSIDVTYSFHKDKI